MIIKKILLPLQPFVIPVKGLNTGKNVFEWHLDGEFFSTFENTEILSADLDAKAVVDYDGCDITVSCRIDGKVTVICDRCLEELEFPVHTGFESDEYDNLSELDLGQDIYDYVCVSLPITKVHPEGQCNAETVKYLCK